MSRRPATAESWIPAPPSSSDLRSWDLDPSWSRTLDVSSHDGSTRRWHVLDSGSTTTATPTATPNVPPSATVVCVHGNPTWAYAWATFLRTFGERCRVIAVDQLGMGFSERTGVRRYADRVRDLDDVIQALDISPDAPLVLAAHDWGGAVAMGWAVDHVDQVDGMVLCNTGIAVPAGRTSPSIIRLAGAGPLRDFVCRRTSTFVEGTVRLSRSKITASDRAAFRAPYKTARSREAIADFVGDIPLNPGGGHPSEAALADVAERLGDISAPVLLAWGASDPVFNDDFAADLAGRFPNSSTHRFPNANHLVMAEADVAGIVDMWLRDLARPEAPTVAADDQSLPPLWSELDRRRSDTDVAFVDVATDSEMSWQELSTQVKIVAADLYRRGLRPGDRVAMLTPPGIELVAAVYGVWRVGGVTVVADRGLGLSGLGQAVRSARPAWVIGPPKALIAAKSLRWAPRATMVSVESLMQAEPGQLPADPLPTDEAAVLFTSGATGPAKGVRYTHGQLAAQRDALAATYAMTPDDRLVAAFAPFALYGPALGTATALPDCDVTKPGQLTADALDVACQRVGATMAFASPSALANVVATAGDDAERAGLLGLRTVFSAGAPVPVETLRALAEMAPNASLHTPYGMTEALPVSDIDLAGIEAALLDDSAGGVCVGPPVAGARVRILPLGFDVEDPPHDIPTGETGEIVIDAAWVSDGYLGLWATERAARPRIDGVDWHRSGDVGHLDDSGRLWVEGRAVHIIDAVDGPITSVPVERRVETELGFARVAAVGVGPSGVQQLVVVIEDQAGSDGLAAADIAQRVRDAVSHPVAAVLTLRTLPVDIRHNAKIDRASVATWAGDLLAGRRTRRPR